MEREDRIKAEAAALWKALYGEPPPLMTDAETMLAVALRSLPEQRYERLRPDQLRPSNVVLPR